MGTETKGRQPEGEKMGARREINRYRTTPSGYDYNDVLRRGKAFHRNSFNGIFEMMPYTSPSDGRTLWSAEFETLPPFKKPDGTRTYKFDETRKRWIEID